jgi:hypothetical protein
MVSDSIKNDLALRDVATENPAAPRACATRGRIDRFERLLDLRDALSEAELQRLVEIADRCPVRRTLEHKLILRDEAALLAPQRTETAFDRLWRQHGRSVAKLYHELIERDS